MSENLNERKLEYVRNCTENISIIAENQDHFLKFVGLGDNEVELQSVKNAIDLVLKHEIPTAIPTETDEQRTTFDSVWKAIELLQTKLPLIVLKWEDEEVKEPGFFSRLAGRFKKNQKEILKNRNEALKNAFDVYYAEREMAKHSYESSVKLIKSMNYDDDVQKAKLSETKETMKSRFRRAEFIYDSAVSEIETKFAMDLAAIKDEPEVVEMTETNVEVKSENTAVESGIILDANPPDMTAISAEVVDPVGPKSEDPSLKVLMDEHVQQNRTIKELNEQIERLESINAAERKRANDALDRIVDRDERLLAQAEQIEELESKVKDLTKVIETLSKRKNR